MESIERILDPESKATALKALTLDELSAHLKELNARFEPGTDGKLPVMTYDVADALYEEISVAFVEMDRRLRVSQRKGTTDDVLELAHFRAIKIRDAAYSAHLKYVPDSSEETVSADGMTRVPLKNLNEHTTQSWTKEEKAR